jgi:pyridinium-3,5-bisthiocarboxylic acid mononucleotide nickel chelatase
MGKHLHIDPFSGIAGDMFLGAMIDLGLPLGEIEKAFKNTATQQSYKLTAEKAMRCGVSGIDFKVHVQEAVCDHDHSHDHGHGHHHHHHHHHVHYRDMLGIVEGLGASNRAKSWARKIVNALADAEATVHGKRISDVHFHEVGGIDSMIDMLGAAVALDLLDVTSLSCGPIPVTHGYVKCDHGKMPLPAPATALLLRNKPVVGLDKRVELVTPTGAAILAGLCEIYGPMPSMTYEKVGYGAGDRDEPDTPNMLRLFLGKLGTHKPAAHQAHTHAQIPTHTHAAGPVPGIAPGISPIQINISK